MDNYKQLSRFRKYHSVLHFFSTRQVGPLGNNEFTSQDPRFLNILQEFEISIQDIVGMNQVHGDTIAVVSNSKKQQIVLKTDGLITKESNLFLFAKTADCMPVFFYDQNLSVIGLAHIGFQGALSRLASKMIQKMVELGSYKENISVGVGPHIRACCYTVSKERIELFEEAFGKDQEFYEVKNGYYYLDLEKILLLQLKEIGIQNDQVEISTSCTSCESELFYSYRKDREIYGDLQGEFMSLIGVTS